MAKEYITFGEIVKGGISEKTGKEYSDFMSIKKDVVLKEGDRVSLKSPASEIKRVSDLADSGKISADKAEAIIEGLEKKKNRVRFILELIRED